MDSKLEPTKRKRTKTDEKYSEEHSEYKPLCKYGENCYQKNSYHLQKFRHPQRNPVPVVKPEQELQVKEKSDESVLCLMSSGSTGMKDQEASGADGTSSVTAEHGIDNQESKEDNSEFACSPLDVKAKIKQKFLVEMPDDFYQLWAFCQSICQQNTLGKLEITELVGPFELLDQTHEKSKPKDKSDNFLTWWRFYYDPPEFQTVMVDDLSKGYHIGYFRDAPNEMPAFVGSNTESEGCVLTPMSDNLFSVVSQLLSVTVKNVDPFKKSQLMSLKKQLEDWADKNGILIEPQNQILKKRKKLMVAKTFYECGIVVPVDKKTKVGYREIPETSANIKKICKKIVESRNISEQNKNSDSLQELVTYVQYANDESDYGMGLELGLDLLAFGGEVFHPTILHLLGVAYELLERKEFFLILKAHLNNRRRLAAAKTEN
uniref:EOG090X0BAY n=1 Tax=Daphnia lumholtzi TaxID=42856 RepID=A0A4Y7M8P3_9CRUS|nr:EOG090X0BAY [Daphnia lumholtzi]